MKIIPTARGYETTTKLPIVNVIPTYIPDADGTGEAEMVFHSPSKTVYTFDRVSGTWTAGSSGGAAGANWALGVTRVYAIDSVGSDTATGYADPATTSTGDYAIASALAGTQAKHTIAGLAAILPTLGNGRNVEIQIAAGTYVGNLAALLAGVTGYKTLLVRGTGTVATAGTTKFDGSVADATVQGAVTTAGMNVGGYNPTGTPTTTTIQCLLVGGGAPGFAGEPALPLGARIRFDSNTTTVALRNVCRMIAKVSGGDTLQLPSVVLPAVPVASDIFYIESPGVTLFTSEVPISVPMASSASFNLVFSGINFTGTMSFVDMGVSICFCTSTGPMVWNNCVNAIASQFYIHTALGVSPNVGGSRAGTSVSASDNCGISWSGLMSTTSTLIANPSALSLRSGWVSGGGCTFSNFTQIPREVFVAGISFFRRTNIGDTTAIPTVTPRIVNGGITFSGGGFVSITQLDIQSTFSVGIELDGIWLLDFSAATANTSVTGNNPSAGLRMQASTRCTLIVDKSHLPTLTGVGVGDLELGNTATSWAQASNFGHVDGGGNTFLYFDTNAIGVPQNYKTPIKFSGILYSAGAAHKTYLNDGGASLATNNATQWDYPSHGFAAGMIFVSVRSNTKTAACTVKLFRNGAAVSGATVTISGGVTGQLPLIIPNLGTQYIAGTDTYDIEVACASSDAGQLELAVVLAVSAG